jgi:hypothetical protein
MQHTTQDGQRWDQIAHEYYGSQTVEIDGVQRSTVGLLIDANPGVPIYDTFPGGVVLDVPILDKAEVITDKEKLPPWKR